MLDKFTFEALLEAYGEEEVLLTKDGVDGYRGKLKEVDNPSVYMHNSEVLFRKYPQLVDACFPNLLDDYVKKDRGYGQLFLGRQGTGSPQHLAANYNVFYMLDGSKEWSFMDPYDMHIQSAMIVWGNAAGFSLALYPDDYPEEFMPAYK